MPLVVLAVESKRRQLNLFKTSKLILNSVKTLYMFSANYPCNICVSFWPVNMVDLKKKTYKKNTWDYPPPLSFSFFVTLVRHTGSLKVFNTKLLFVRSRMYIGQKQHINVSEATCRLLISISMTIRQKLIADWSEPAC